MKQLIRVRYDGSGFCGYQVQPDKRTVQGELNHAAKMLFGVPCDVTGCSRTDSGVHANCFFATVVPKDDGGGHIPTEKLPQAFNALLSEDVAVSAAYDVPDSFHPRYDVLNKEYIYLIHDSHLRDPFYHGRAYFFGKELTEEDVSRMNRGANYLLGTHDFRAFMAQGSKIENTERHIFSADFQRKNGHLVFSVRADGFLYNMVRIMVGTLLDVGTGRFDPSDIGAMIESRDRKNAGNTAPACGLYLNEVNYPEKFGITSKKREEENCDGQRKKTIGKNAGAGSASLA